MNTLQATIRMRTNRSTAERTIRRQTTLRSRRDSTVHRRASTTQDVQVSMLPDLSENISNEQTIWEEIMQIKTMPIPMVQKKELKAKILVSFIRNMPIMNILFLLSNIFSRPVDLQAGIKLNLKYIQVQHLFESLQTVFAFRRRYGPMVLLILISTIGAEKKLSLYQFPSKY